MLRRAWGKRPVALVYYRNVPRKAHYSPTGTSSRWSKIHVGKHSTEETKRGATQARSLESTPCDASEVSHVVLGLGLNSHPEATKGKAMQGTTPSRATPKTWLEDSLVLLEGTRVKSRFGGASTTVQVPSSPLKAAEMNKQREERRLPSVAPI